ncbi:hypothetical protein BJN34_22140 [Cupriavidus necator]|uniref:Uncharacterized protein n=1 Tax=Cupriavidus necator TaxID=106590 RepID=A0A1U9UV90_CUPNE|nr:hypothetical protein [Cupriavidus necator]AQV96570.1 hypothetical protein BJN34_22140 [Cupriavidus necator]
MSETNDDPLQIVLTIQCDEERPYFEFVERLREIGLVSKYQLAQVTSPALFFRREFVEYIAEHGLHSLFKLQLVMEDITSPSMALDEVEAVVTKFVRTLLPAKRLVIVDPYFYRPGSDTDAFVARLLGQQAATLEQVFILSNGSGSMKSKMHAAFASVAPNVAVFDTSTDVFHDRFWLNPDQGTGIVMGTSLNGLGKRIALVDKLSRSDAQEVLAEARKLSPNI